MAPTPVPAVATIGGCLLVGWVPMPLAGAKVVQQPFVDSLFAFASYDTQHRGAFAGYILGDKGYIPASRNHLAEQFVASGKDWLLSLDWDISFHPEDVYTLLDAADPIDRPIIAGCYVTYMGPRGQLMPCWTCQKGDEEWAIVTQFDEGEIVPLTGCGMGFTLIHRDAFLQVAKAHQDDPWPWYGHDICEGSDDRLGEDLTFTARARRAGLSIWGHGGVMVGHTKARMMHPMEASERSV